MNTYKTQGTCSTQINFEVDNRIVKNVKFNGGCRGNSNAVQNLVEGMDIDLVIKKLKGIPCHGTTSCPDQLARALEIYKEKNNL